MEKRNQAQDTHTNSFKQTHNTILFCCLFFYSVFCLVSRAVKSLACARAGLPLFAARFASFCLCPTPTLVPSLSPELHLMRPLWVTTEASKRVV
jgi:hypothetical protein